MKNDIHLKVSQQLLKVFLDADLHYQLNGTPHHIYLDRQSKCYLGQARRIITQVAALGPKAKIWMDHFIKEMSDDAEVCR